jgi:hypothetical protein
MKVNTKKGEMSSAAGEIFENCELQFIETRINELNFYGHRRIIKNTKFGAAGEFFEYFWSTIVREADLSKV